MLTPWKKSYDQPRWHIKKQRHYFANKDLSNQSYGFSSSHLWTWELDHKESWVPMNWCFWTVVLQKTLESTLDCKEIQPVHPKGNQSWVFFGRSDAKAETPVLCHLMQSWLTGKDWCWEGLGAGEGDDRGWHGWMASPTRWTWVWVNSWHATVHGVTKSRTRLSNWTELNWYPVRKATQVSFSFRHQNKERLRENLQVNYKSRIECKRPRASVSKRVRRLVCIHIFK